MIVAVAGGTGLVGRLVGTALRAEGHTPRVLARAAGVDLVSGTGLEGAMAGVSRVIDVSNVRTTSRRKAIAFFQQATANLVQVGEKLGIEHQVALSIVGVDRVDTGYYAGKLAQEQALAAGRVPWSVLRATQFHEFTDQMLATPGPLIPGPVMLSQPIAAAEVASALVELVLGDPVGLAPELAGPEPLRMLDLVGRTAKARGSHRPVVPVRLPGAAGKAMAGGALLPAGPGPRGEIAFEMWLTPPEALIEHPLAALEPAAGHDVDPDQDTPEGRAAAEQIARAAETGTSEDLVPTEAPAGSADAALVTSAAGGPDTEGPNGTGEDGGEPATLDRVADVDPSPASEPADAGEH